MYHEIINRIVSKVAHKKHIFGAVFYASSQDECMDFIGAAGNMTVDSPYYIASINKLFVSAVMLKLAAEGKVNLKDPLVKFLSSEGVGGLHVHDGKDCSESLTLTHLLSQTSGLPCYLQDKQANGRMAMKDLEAGIDQAWPISKVIETVKLMRPHFAPGEGNKARYGDTGHQLLGLVIEAVTGKPIQSVLTELFQDLGMERTHVFETGKAIDCSPIYYKGERRDILQFLTSTGNDIVSTAHDQMIFIKAFFNGHFYPKERLSELMVWRSIFFPFQYGIGLQRFHMPRWLSPFQAIPEMIGHSGSTGAVSFYVPAKKVFITGTINQQARPSLSFQAMIKIARVVAL